MTGKIDQREFVKWQEQFFSSQVEDITDGNPQKTLDKAWEKAETYLLSEGKIFGFESQGSGKHNQGSNDIGRNEGGFKRQNKYNIGEIASIWSRLFQA